MKVYGHWSFLQFYILQFSLGAYRKYIVLLYWTDKGL